MKTLAGALMRNLTHRWAGNAAVTVVVRYYSAASTYDPASGKTTNVFQDSLPVKVIPQAVTEEDRVRYNIQTSSRKVEIAAVDLLTIPDTTSRLILNGVEYIIEKVALKSLDSHVTLFVKGL